MVRQAGLQWILACGATVWPVVDPGLWCDSSRPVVRQPGLQWILAFKYAAPSVHVSCSGSLYHSVSPPCTQVKTLTNEDHLTLNLRSPWPCLSLTTIPINPRRLTSCCSVSFTHFMGHLASSLTAEGPRGTLLETISNDPNIFASDYFESILPQCSTLCLDQMGF